MPFFKTRTLSHVRATTPRSCVIRITDIKNLSFTSNIKSRICSCTVTSKAVVGSSAINRSGFVSKVVAIIARCLMPPESSKEYPSILLSGSGILTARNISTQRSLASFLFSLLCCLKTPDICSPIVMYGFSELIGSWNIIATSLPLILFNSLSGSPSISLFLKITLPVATPFGSSRPIRESTVWLLPEPDSPTIPKTSFF